jgi:hypothetical protein
MPYFAPGGEIYFPGADGFVYKIRPDGSGKRRMFDQRVAEIYGLSPNGEWIVGVYNGADLAFPTRGGSPIAIRTLFSRVRWSQDGKRMFIQAGSASMSSGATGRNYVFPLKPGKMLPDLPPGGFRSEEEMAKYPGVALSRPRISRPGPRLMSTPSRKRPRSGTCSGFRCVEARFATVHQLRTGTRNTPPGIHAAVN